MPDVVEAPPFDTTVPDDATRVVPDDPVVPDPDDVFEPFVDVEEVLPVLFDPAVVADAPGAVPAV